MPEVLRNLLEVAAILSRMGEPLPPEAPEPEAPPAWLAYEPDANGVTYL